MELLHEYRLSHELDALGFRERSQQPLLDIQRDTLHREVERHCVATDTNTQAEHTVSRQQSWDSVGRLQQQSYQGLQLNNLSSFEPLVNLQQRHYHYDGLGQLLKIEQPKQSQYYAYDPQGRLAGARLGEHGSPVESWQFDWAGNPLPALNAEQPKPQDWSERVRQHWQDPNFNLLSEGTQAPSEQVAYWPDNRVLYSDHAQYQYDAQGNRTQHTEHNGENNQLNQLQRVDRYTADNRLTRSLYRYDPLGRRLVKQVQHYSIENNQLHETAEAQVEFYGWDGDRLAFTQTEEYQWHVIYEPGSFTPLLQLQQPTNTPISEQDKELAEVMGSLQSTLDYLSAHEAYELSRSVREQTIAQLKANEQWQTPQLPEECYFYHCNHLGLPEALTNQKGEAVWAASYDAWGNVKKEYNPNNLHQPIRLPGQYHDKETDLYYNRHRYYDPKLGNYINQNPIGLASGEPNLTVYPRNPIQGMDPLGLLDLPAIPPQVLGFTVGVADAASLGLGPLARQALDIDGGVNRCSNAYSTGEWASLGLGIGRMAYAGLAKVGAAIAADGAGAVAFRNVLKRIMRGPFAGSNYRIKSYDDLLAKYGSDESIQAAAGRTNSAINAVGADLSIGSAVNSAACRCP